MGYDPEQLSTLRTRKQMTQADFYGLIGLTAKSGSCIESGQRALSEPESLLVYLIHELGCDVRLIGSHNAAKINAVLQATTAYVED